MRFALENEATPYQRRYCRRCYLTAYASFARLNYAAHATLYTGLPGVSQKTLAAASQASVDSFAFVFVAPSTPEARTSFPSLSAFGSLASPALCFLTPPPLVGCAISSSWLRESLYCFAPFKGPSLKLTHQNTHAFFVDPLI